MSDLFQDFESFGKGGSDGFGASIPSSSVSANPFDDINVQTTSSIKPNDQFNMKRKVTEYPILRHFDTSRIRVPSAHITHVVVSNSIVTICCLGNSIFRYDLNTENASENCEIKRDDDARIHKVFQDPKAQHLLVCMMSKETYYITRGGQKRPQPRLLSKLKGHLVDSVAWNLEEQTDQTTGAILFGTSEGLIYESVIEAQEKRKTYCVEVHELMQDMKGHIEPITGMHMQLFPANFGGSAGKWFVLVTTPCRIYQFIGHATKISGEVQFQEMFNFYKDYVKIQFQEIPGVLKDSKLCLWPQKQHRLPSSFAWLTGAGVYYGTLAFGSQEPGESVFIEKNLIPYTAASESGDDRDGKVEWNQKDTVLPIGLALTEFHCVLLFRDKIVAICHLNNKKVFEEPFNMRRYGPLTGVCSDPVTGNLWTWAKMILQAYHPYKEGRNIWKIYLDQERFQLAQKHAEGNQASLDLILVRQAEHHFKEGKYEDAAEDFSKSHLSFEEVALKFLQVDKKEALKKFLHLKLNSLNVKDKTQRTMLTIWLTEMYLNELGVHKDSNKTDLYLNLQGEFQDFLQNRSIRDSLYHNSGTIYNLMLSHGATEDVIFFAKLMEDYDRVIEHYIQHYQYEDALKTLSTQSLLALQVTDKAKRRAKFQRLSEMYYKFSPVLIKHIPQETVEAWIACERCLNPKKLIPSLIQCNQTEGGSMNQGTPEKQNAAAIQYLQFCVDKLKSQEPSVHNFLVSAYANSTDPDDHEKLISYLAINDGLMPNYDVQYALRMCLEKQLDRACVYIYSAMGLYEECVKLSLTCGQVDLARRMINVNPIIRKDDLLKRKLWLKIAEHLIKKEKDIGKAMQFLKECDILKIEDILPFFEDVVTIDQFKDAICDSLESYNNHIDHLKKEMDTATTSAKNIRSDIQEIRNKCVLIQSNQKCYSCEGRLLAQPFYMFPCRHSFHHDCLCAEILKTKLAYEKNKYRRPTNTDVTAEDIGSDCPFCGISMIASISIPLIPMDTLQDEIKKWV